MQHAHHGFPSASCERGAGTYGRGMMVWLGDRIEVPVLLLCGVGAHCPGGSDGYVGCAVLVVVVVRVGGGCGAADSPPGVS